MTHEPPLRNYDNIKKIFFPLLVVGFQFFYLYYSSIVNLCLFPSIASFHHTLIRYVVILWLLFPSIATFYHTTSVTLLLFGYSHQLHPSTILYLIKQCLLLEFQFVPDATGHGVLLGLILVMPVGHGNGFCMPPRNLRTLPPGIRFQLPPRPSRSIQMSIQIRGDGLTPLLWEITTPLRLWAVLFTY